MRLYRHGAVSFFTIWLLCGCQPSADRIQPLPTQTTVTVSPGPAVPYPQYESWSQFAIGTKIVRRKEVSNANGKVVETETLKLIEKSDKRVVVESQTLVERSTGVNDDNPPQLFQFPATFQLPASMTVEQFKLPSLKAELKGEETIDVLGQTYRAKIYEWTEVNEAGPMSVRLLWCDNFPGGKVSQEMRITLTGTNSLEKIAAADLIRAEVPNASENVSAS